MQTTLTKTDAVLLADKMASNLKRSLGDNSQEWSFQYLSPQSKVWEHSAQAPYSEAVRMRRHYLINAARELLGREPFTQAETNEMAPQRWQHFV